MAAVIAAIRFHSRLVLCDTPQHAGLKERLRLLEAREGDQEIVGDSAAIRRVVAAALKVAVTNANVLLTGESGTGKELVANAIHAHSARRGMPCVKVNCSAIAENLLETELFGHVKGAFTGANAAKRGLFEVAHRGTLFLDEVGDLSLAAQRDSESRADKTTVVDVRVVAATHKDLQRSVAEGRFREDLFYRLNVVPLQLPNLRERKDDIPLLTQFILARLCVKHNVKAKPLDDEAVIELQQYSWPGNVRELSNVLERALIMSGERITVMDLPEELLDSESAGDKAVASRAAAGTLKQQRDAAEREVIISTLRRHSGNISQGALELGVRRPYLHRRMTTLGIGKKDYFS